MKLVLTFATLLVVGASNIPQQSTSQRNANDVSQSHVAWVVASMQEMATVKAGMTRSDVLKIFREEGGLSSPDHQSYEYRDCPYFKVDVEFRPAAGTFPAQVRRSEMPTDIVVSVSRPYLAWMRID
jgi:hypothetical protein